MKKTLVALAAFAATSAFAQSSVTMSGQVQYGFAKSAANAISTGGLKGDRNYLNINATEDLGGGNKAGIFLQNRFQSQDGAQTTSYTNSGTGNTYDTMWEQSGLQFDSAQLGQVKVGRFSSHLVSVNGTGHYMEDWASGTHSGTSYGRNSGQFQYTSPKFMGAELFVLTAAGANNKYMTSKGNGYTNTASTTTSTTVTQQNNMNTYGFNYTQGAFRAQAANTSGFNHERLTFLNAAYNFGVVEVAVNQQNLRDDITSVTNTYKAHKTTEYGIKAPIGASATIAWAHQTNDKEATSAAGTKKSVNAVRGTYNFSKRTWAEALVSKTSNAFSTSTYAADATANGRAYYMGVAHSF